MPTTGSLMSSVITHTVLSTKVGGQSWSLSEPVGYCTRIGHRTSIIRCHSRRLERRYSRKSASKVCWWHLPCHTSKQRWLTDGWAEKCRNPGMPKQSDVEQSENKIDSLRWSASKTSNASTAAVAWHCMRFIYESSEGRVDHWTVIIKRQQQYVRSRCTRSGFYALTAWVKQPFKRFISQSTSPNCYMRRKLGGDSQRQPIKQQIDAFFGWSIWKLCSRLLCIGY